MRLWSSICALLLLVTSGCVRSSNGEVTISSPTVPPSATQTLKDGLLAAKIRAEVVSVDVDAATHLGVHVHGGDVLISGVVRNSSERSKIDVAVRKVGGVHQLNDEIRIDSEGAIVFGWRFRACRARYRIACRTNRHQRCKHSRER